MLDPGYDIFVRIVDAGSISAAARQKALSTPAVSKRLARLEERLGVKLLHRTTRRLALTTAGKDLYDTLIPIRAALESAEERLASRDAQIVGSLRISAPTSFGRMLVVPSLVSFMARFPAIKLTIDLSDEYTDLLSGEYDLAIRIGTGIGSGLVGHRIGTSTRVLCAAPSYLANFGEPVSISDLAGHYLLATDSQLPWRLDGPDGALVVNGTSHIRTNSSEVVRELAVCGSGIALRSLWDVADALNRGELMRVLAQHQGTQEAGIFAVHAPITAPSAKLSALIDHLKTELGKQLGSWD
jgi:DNA-binding transcriptional LysR family regulator